jgi:glycosyltransferase involved in cell wall biosynthesis
MKKISVVLCTYNGQKTVEKTVLSIVNQEGNGINFSIELIVIDDCSTDDTFSILQQFDCVLVKNEKNSGGPNKGRNIGIKMATGDFICIADQDDVWVMDKIQLSLPYLDLAPIITSGYNVIDLDNNRKIERVNASKEGYVLFDKNATFLNKLSKSIKGQNTYLGSIIYSKQLKDILFEEHFGVVDYDWILRLFNNQSSLEISQSLYVRYVSQENLSLNEKYRKIDFYYSLFTLEEYENQYPKEVALSYKKIHGTRAKYYYLSNNMKKSRFYFLKANFSLKTVMYYLTTFYGHKIVKKHFHLFG